VHVGLDPEPSRTGAAKIEVESPISSGARPAGAGVLWAAADRRASSQLQAGSAAASAMRVAVAARMSVRRMRTEPVCRGAVIAEAAFRMLQ
jgi:hypothetical protein